MAKSLIKAIQEVANCPCTEHQDAFLNALASTSELLFRVVDTNTPTSSVDQRPIEADEEIHLAKVDAQGLTFLLAFPDLDTARRSDPRATFVGIRRDEALHMVLSDASLDGLLVITATAEDAWAAASRERIQTLLSNAQT